MTKEEFIEAQTQLGLTNQGMADVLSCSKSAVEKYRGGINPIPKRVEAVIFCRITPDFVSSDPRVNQALVEHLQRLVPSAEWANFDPILNALWGYFELYGGGK